MYVELRYRNNLKKRQLMVTVTETEKVIQLTNRKKAQLSLQSYYFLNC